MTMKAMKFRIKDEIHSKAIQEKLFELGYKWSDTESTAQQTDATYLYAESNGRIMHTDELSNNFFENDSNTEYILSDGELMPLDEKGVAVKSEGDVQNGINPKQALGQASLPLNLFSPLATAYGSIGKLNGKLKYGMSNFVATPVIASIYADAIRRHLDKWMAGQEVDEADGVPHFAAMLANIDILLCARAAGTLVDDRPLLKGFEAEMEKLTPIVKALHELHKDKQPHHHLLSEKNLGTE